MSFTGDNIASVARLRLSSLLSRAPVRRDAKSAFYNVLDYLSQPFLLLIATPIVVRYLGLEMYGIWAVVNGLAGGVAVLGLGIGDAAIKHVAACRGRSDYAGAARVVEATVSLSITTALVTGGLVRLTAGTIARYAFHINASDHALVATAIRVGAVLLALRWIESAYTGTLKAHERYDISARVCIATEDAWDHRHAVILALYGYGVIAILLASAAFTFIGILVLAWQVRGLDPHMSLLPAVDLAEWRRLASFGAFSGIQSIANIIFTQADRLLVGATIGPAAAGAYSICLQLVQPIQTICAQAFNFVVPRISHKAEAGDHASAQHFLRNILMISVALSVALSLPLLLAGKPLLSFYMGPEFAKTNYAILPVLTIAFAVVSISVVPYYALLGKGQVRFVAFLNLLAGIIAAGCAAWWIPHVGAMGAAFSRLLYGSIACGSFLRLAKTFKLPSPSLLDAAPDALKP